MTRKALRKKRQQEAKRQLQPSGIGPRSSWVTVGALVASAAIGIRPASAAPLELSFARSQPSPHVRWAFGPSSEFDDPRPAPLGLPLVSAVFRALQDPASAPAGTPRRFDIPPGPIGDAIIAFQRVTAVTVTLEIESIGSIQSPGASGAFSVEEALRALLTGTGVRFRLTSPTTAVFELDPVTESVDVTGQISVVASPKYVVPLRDIPQTIEVIPRAAMEQQGVTTLSEALRNVPGITLQAGEGGGASSTAGDMFNMRGFNASNSLFVDNVRDDGLISRDVFNLEQVEVFMGPTGSDVGRGTAAGYVNMQTKTPHLPASSSATLTFGSANQRRVTVDVNQPLSLRQRRRMADEVGRPAERAVAGQRRGRPRRGRERHARPSRRRSASGSDTPRASSPPAQILRQDNLPDYGIPGAAWHGSAARADDGARARRRSIRRNYYGSPAYDYDHATQNTVTGARRARRQPAADRVEPDPLQRDAARSGHQHRPESRRRTSRSRISSRSRGRATCARTRSPRTRRRLTGRFATGRVRAHGSAGLEFIARSAVRARRWAASGTRAPVNIYTPESERSGHRLRGRRRPARSPTARPNTVALYGFDSVDLGPRVQVNGGLRFEHYDTSSAPVDATNVTTTDAIGHRTASSAARPASSFSRATNGNVYVSYGTTVTPPGAANFTLSAQANNQNNPNVKPQESANLEVGTKWDVADGRLSLTGAVFHTINKNVIFTVDAAAVPPIYNQDDKQRRERRHGRRDRPDHAALAGAGELLGYLDTESLIAEPAEQRQAADALAGVLGKRLDDLSAAEGV